MTHFVQYGLRIFHFSGRSEHKRDLIGFVINITAGKNRVIFSTLLALSSSDSDATGIRSHNSTTKIVGCVYWGNKRTEGFQI